MKPILSSKIKGLYVFLLISSFYIFSVFSEFVESYDGIKEIIDNFEEDELIIELEDDKSIEINENIIFNKNLSSLSIYGSSSEVSELKFNNNDLGFIFNGTIDRIEFKNIKIVGNFNFTNFLDVAFEEVIIDGTIYFKNRYRETQEMIGYEDEENYYLEDVIPNIEFYEMIFHCNTNSVDNCINLFGNIKIENSYFYGSPLCKNSILSINGMYIGEVAIATSYFNGVFSNNCVSINNAGYLNLESSNFENCSSYEDVGGSIKIEAVENSFIMDNSFKNSYTSYDGGVFYIFDAYSVEIYDTKVYNSTALGKGSFIFADSSVNYSTEASLENIIIKGVGKTKELIKGGGYLISVEGNSKFKVELLEAYDISGGNGSSLFTISDKSSLKLYNLYIKDVKGYGGGGLLFSSNNELIGSEFLINNGTFINFYQYSIKKSSTFLWVMKNIDVKLYDCNLDNFYGNNGYFVYSEGYSNILFDNVHLNFHNSQLPTVLFKNENSIKNSGYNEISSIPNVLTLNYFVVENFYSSEALFDFNIGEIYINDSEFSNVSNCLNSDCMEESKNIEEKKKNHIFNVGLGTILEVQRSSFNNIIGTIGIKGERYSNFTINDCTFSNNNFEGGLISINTLNKNFGYYKIENTKFYNNSGIDGSILNVENIDEGSSVNISNSVFESNSAKKFGGIIYTVSDKANEYISFDKCEFINCTESKSGYGAIAYSYSMEKEPFFSNKDELRNTKSNFATNPTQLRFTNDSLSSFSILSGDTIEKEIKCEFYDDYDNKREILYISNLESANDVVFYNTEVTGDNNAMIIGQTGSFCLDNMCSSPLVKIVGNPGNYNLSLHIIAFGPYKKFKNNVVNVEFTIEKCNSNQYLYQDIENVGLKTCYIPKCYNDCNNFKGKCIGNNICDCSKSKFKGDFCDERYHLDRLFIFDLTFKIISILLAVITIIVMALIVKYRKNLIIKAASINFSFIILLGVLFNNYFIGSMTYEKNKKIECILSYLTENLGFVFIYGSILVKTYRVYKIFTCNGKRVSFKESKMISMVLVMVMFHIILIFIWLLNDTIKPKIYYTPDEKEYIKCYYSSLKNLSVFFNVIILLLGAALTYFTRNVRKEFKEDISLPVYFYLVLKTFIIIIELQNLSVIIEDLIESIGGILNSIVILYYLYIDKLIIIIFHNSGQNNTTTVYV